MPGLRRADLGTLEAQAGVERRTNGEFARHPDIEEAMMPTHDAHGIEPRKEPLVSSGDTFVEPFARVICAIDATRESLEAARQSAQLMAPTGRLTLVSVVVDTVFEPETAQQALIRAADEVRSLHNADTRLLLGPPAELLLEQIVRTGATLAAVGIHSASRTGAILLGGSAADVLFQAPCSVLVARPPVFPGRFPGQIVVGVDGSPQSLTALEVATRLRDRLGSTLRVLAARGGKGIAMASLGAEDITIEPDAPVTVLVNAAQDADLVVVGSRGLHGVRTLGSVSERVAYQAACSVLVVRSTTR
jgi:nucleotide-binding universal stress UspA family protein